MEVYFLDVAQGACQIILLGERRAIMLDCGAPNNRMALQFLRRLGIEYLECLIVSHSHHDHMGGAVSVLGDFQDRMGRICFVQDDLFLGSVFWRRISDLLRAGTLRNEQLIRLEASDAPQVVWSDERRHACLKTFSPTAAENLSAQEAGLRNPTSAVLFFNAGNHRIIFAADSEVSQWREIRRKAGQRMNCSVLAVPHHAGRTHNSPEELAWLFDQAIAADVAVISVGTSNTHGHPRPDVVGTLTARDTKVLCTQITRCCNHDLEALRPGVLQPVQFPGKSSPVRDVTSAGNSRNVACAGTVRVLISAAGLEVDRLAAHQKAVDALATLGPVRPLCRDEAARRNFAPKASAAHDAARCHAGPPVEDDSDPPGR